MAERYRINETFLSIQGEGIRVGTLNVFVRFSGCNMRCVMAAGPKSPGGFDCDTEFESGEWYTAEELARHCRELGGKCRAVIFTGGEPGLQVDDELLQAFGGWYLAIETNGTINVAGNDGKSRFDWVTVSPKVSENQIAQLVADEVKYVRGVGQPIPEPFVQARYKLISPAFSGLNVDPEAVAWCVQLTQENPEWRLTVQTHKLLGLR